MSIHRIIATGVGLWAVGFFLALLFARRDASFSKFFGRRTRSYRLACEALRSFAERNQPLPCIFPAEYHAPRLIKLIDWLLIYGFLGAFAVAVLGWILWGLVLLFRG
jgi:hypothetical protein